MCITTYDQILEMYYCKTGAEERIAVLKLELDYELAVLSEAIQNNDQSLIERAKARLHEIWKELLQLEYF